MPFSIPGRILRPSHAVSPEIGWEEICFYYDPSGKAYRGLHSYYRCRPLTVELLRDEEVRDGSAAGPRWVEIGELRPDDFQIGGETILSLARAA